MRLKKIIFCYFILLFCVKAGFSQTVNPYVFIRVDSVEIKIAGNLLKNAWAGGINYAQLGAIDINMDGIKDLVVFDRTGNKISTYINGGTANTVDYTFDASYNIRFPKLNSFMLLYDYNCDGKEDIFTSTSGGMACYKNTSTIASGLQFEKVTDLILSKYGANLFNLYVSSVDLAALADLDNDGDMDILTFSLLGSYVEHHINKSKELYGHCDSLVFEMVNSCWGSFYEGSSDNNCVLGISCKGGSGVINHANNDDDTKSIKHAGSTLLAIDLDGDGDKELMLGDVSHNNIILLTNGGDATTANMTAQLDSFPANSKKVNLPVFPGAFYLDVNNDGLKDLLFSPNSSAGSENANSVWYYKNVGTSTVADFAFQQNNFLQNQMIEVGEGAHPNFVDYNADGLLDIAIGCNGYYQPNGTLKSKLAMFKNIGTTTQPKFELVNYDYSTISQYNFVGFYPAFGDVDGDGDKDIIAGLADGTLCFLENNAASGNPANYILHTTNYQGIDVGQYSAPQLIDVNRDGLLDLLIGERSGNINYYKNTGTLTSATFTLVTANFGSVNVSPYNNIVGYSSPRMVDAGGVYTLFSGSDQGGINRYTSIDANLSGTFIRNDSVYAYINEDIRTSIDIADITGDGYPEMIIGNARGGVSFFINDPTKVGIRDLNNNEKTSYTIFPNPTENVFTIQSNSINQTTVKLFNLLGQEQIIEQVEKSKTELIINVAHLAQGIYVLHIYSKNNSVASERIIIQR